MSDPGNSDLISGELGRMDAEDARNHLMLCTTIGHVTILGFCTRCGEEVTR